MFAINIPESNPAAKPVSKSTTRVSKALQSPLKREKTAKESRIYNMPVSPPARYPLSLINFRVINTATNMLPIFITIFTAGIAPSPIWNNFTSKAKSSSAATVTISPAAVPFNKLRK